MKTKIHVRFLELLFSNQQKLTKTLKKLESVDIQNFLGRVF
jgi:hypothetical protein